MSRIFTIDSHFLAFRIHHTGRFRSYLDSNNHDWAFCGAILVADWMVNAFTMA